MRPWLLLCFCVGCAPSVEPTHESDESFLCVDREPPSDAANTLLLGLGSADSFREMEAGEPLEVTLGAQGGGHLTVSTLLFSDGGSWFLQFEALARVGGADEVLADSIVSAEGCEDGWLDASNLRVFVNFFDFGELDADLRVEAYRDSDGETLEVSVPVRVIE